jgi:hypothetical protein
MYLIGELTVAFGSIAENLHSVGISNILFDFFHQRLVPGGVGQLAGLRPN